MKSGDGMRFDGILLLTRPYSMTAEPLILIPLEVLNSCDSPKREQTRINRDLLEGMMLSSFSRCYCPEPLNPGYNIRRSGCHGGSNTFNLYAPDVSGNFKWERRYSTGLGYRRNCRATPLR